jgi:hypothetical protein
MSSIFMVLFFGFSSFSEQVAVPPAPTLTYPVDNDAIFWSSLTFKWGESSCAMWYHFQISRVPDFTSTIVDTTLTGNFINLIVSGFNPTYYEGMRLYWRVSAKNESSEVWSTVWKFNLNFSYFSLVSPINNQSGMSLNPTLRWGAVSNAAAYQVQVATDTNFSATLTVANDSTVTDTSKIIGPLLINKMYFWRVRARNVEGWSGIWTTRWAFICGNGSNVLSKGNSGVRALMTNSGLSIKYTLPAAENVYIRVYSTQGRIVARWAGSHQAAGLHDVRLDRANFSPGNYILDFRAGSYSVRKMAFVIR